MKVPSEGDIGVSKRKAEDDNVEEEKKRRKKRKKQSSTSRPACSWVYFSQEFIKEYSASHPESSGLKAATKAASDAWKSMTLEEKAKYTKRAREVWDSYLSTVPPRSPKPRTQTKLVTRCSPGRLFNVLQRFTLEQKAAVKSMGFGSLLGLRCRTLRRSLCLWLLERFNTAQCSLDVCGEHIPLSPHDVELVMGLAASGKDVVNSGPDEAIADLRKSYNATNHGISIHFLEEQLADPEAGEDFRRAFVLYTLGTVLSPTARLDVSPSFLHILTNMDVIHQYNWGKFLLERLVREVTRFRQGKQRAVGGCLLFLQLFYYESISVEGSAVSSPCVIPCLSSWGEVEIMEREKREKELGGYGLGKVITKERCLSEDLLESQQQIDYLPISATTTTVEHYRANEMGKNQENMKNKDAGCGDIEMVIDSIRGLCRNKDFGCTETVEYMKINDHEQACIYVPCACPLFDCHFVGLSEQLSLHFSSKHWDAGTHFRYNSPFSVSLAMNEKFLVLQAEEDGSLFLLNKGAESIGNTVMITCIGPRSSKGSFLYDLVCERGISSLRLKSSTQNFPGWMKRFPPMDFLLIPFSFLGSSRQLNLEVCIWSSNELGQDLS